MMADYSTFVSKVPILEKNIIWKIPNISKSIETNKLLCETKKKERQPFENWIRKLQFEIGDDKFSNNLSIWELQLSRIEASSKYLSLHLIFLGIVPSLLCPSITVLMTVEGVDSPSKKLWPSTKNSLAWSYGFAQTRTVYGWPKLINIADMIPLNLTELKPEDDNLSLRIRLEFEDRNGTVGFLTSNNKILESKCQAVARDAYLASSNDIVLVLINNEVLHANGTILSVQNAVFAKMFETDMKENATRRIVIPDISIEAMKVVLKFIYTGSLPLAGNEWNAWLSHPGEIINAAEKYGLTMLKKFCDYNLAEQCTKENALELLQLSRLFELRNATNRILSYMKQNIDVIHGIGTVGWKRPLTR